MKVKKRTTLGLFLFITLFCLTLHSISIKAFPVNRLSAQDLRGACKYQALVALQ